jgi:DNA-binding XRE family transcriptional regulator
MLTTSEFAKFVGVSRETVSTKHQGREVLGLRGARRGLRFPKWQVSSNVICYHNYPGSSVCSEAIAGLFIVFSISATLN